MSAVGLGVSTFPRTRRWSIATAIISVVIIAIVGLWYLLGRGQPTPTDLNPKWIAVERKTIDTTVSATGTVRLKTGAQVRVGAQLSGIVQRLNVSIGSHVGQGDVIAEIDSRAVRAKIAQAQAQLARDTVALDKAKHDEERMSRLNAEQAISLQQADDARATLQLAQATVQSSERALDAANVDLNYVSIRAPISGTIASVSTQQGETVAASFATPTFVTIIQDDALEVVAMVDEADIGNVRVGQTVNFTTETYPDKDFTAHVTRIAPVATIDSGVVNYEVGISVDGDMKMLKPDMTTNVTIQTTSHTGLFVPATAVHQAQSGKFVLIRAPGGGQDRRTVATLGRKGENVEIAKGLAGTESVLIGGRP